MTLIGLLVVAIGQLSFTSCTHVDLFEKTVTLPGHKWDNTYKPSFKFNIKDTTSAYNLFIVLRHNDKLKHSGLSPYFKQVITSEGSNSLKPKKEIFDFAFQKTGATPDESIMIGDTMEVDILGAINAGIDQIHVNHLTNEPESINGKLPTHTVYSLKELEGIF